VCVYEHPPSHVEQLDLPARKTGRVIMLCFVCVLAAEQLRSSYVAGSLINGVDMGGFAVRSVVLCR
jgi:hypothetical protein